MFWFVIQLLILMITFKVYLSDLGTGGRCVDLFNGPNLFYLDTGGRCVDLFNGPITYLQPR